MGVTDDDTDDDTNDHVDDAYDGGPGTCTQSRLKDQLVWTRRSILEEIQT